MTAATQTWILRVSVVLGMVVAVVTVLYFTPMPEHHFKSCDRPCHELDWPMICRTKLTLELYHTMGKHCEDCPPTNTNCSTKDCIIADGYKRSLLSVNRMLPGPSINVCQNDIVVVDVTNKVPGQEFTIHWRGQKMKATPCMDGVPMVTQCPIPSFTTFQYKFRATEPGTHLWHAHSNSHTADGIFGVFTVRQPELLDPQKRFYDIDTSNYSLVISEWNRKSTFNKMEIKPSLLLNGQGNFEGHIPKFYVKVGLRYRFRLGYVGGASSCPVQLSVAGHHLKVIALDGHPTVPYEASFVILGRGERLDFVLKTNTSNKHTDTFLIQVISTCQEEANPVFANLIYENLEINEFLKQNQVKLEEHSRIFHTEVCNSQIGKICVNDAQSLLVMPPTLRSERVDNQFYVLFNHLIIEKHDSGKSLAKIPRVNNITFTFPSSPLLSQPDDILMDSVCSSEKRPKRCQGHDVCECVHVEQIPLDNSVELILVDGGNNNPENIFHLHGYSFYVVGYRQFEEIVPLEEIKLLDTSGQLFKRNLKSPVYKDTIRIPKNSVIAIRFVADNPGYWMLRDEHAIHWSRGMDVIFQVGSKRDFQSIPFNFPKCGNWIGPEFFLA